jgi:hypothetical protein
MPGQCPHINAKIPLTRDYACPRWDSNRVPALAYPPLLRKHAESEPVRPMYDPIRGPNCAHCAHALWPILTGLTRHQMPVLAVHPMRTVVPQRSLVDARAFPSP